MGTEAQRLPQQTHDRAERAHTCGLAQSPLLRLDVGKVGCATAAAAARVGGSLVAGRRGIRPPVQRRLQRLDEVARRLQQHHVVVALPRHVLHGGGDGGGGGNNGGGHRSGGDDDGSRGHRSGGDDDGSGDGSDISSGGGTIRAGIMRQIKGENG